MPVYTVTVGYRTPTKFPACSIRATHYHTMRIEAENPLKAAGDSISRAYQELQNDCEHVRPTNIVLTSD